MQSGQKKKTYTPLGGLLPEDLLGKRFLQYFNHPWGFIYAPVPQAGVRPAWQTETRYPLQPRNLWSQYLNLDVLLGLKFGKWTRYVMFDIDHSSQYLPHNDREGYDKVLAALEDIGLCRPVPIQSSESGGIHLYYFFKSEVHSFSLSCAVSQALKKAGLKIKAGQLEIFPNPKPYSKGKPTNFKAHRLPLQVGSYMLDADLQPESNDLCQFLDAADWSAKGQDEQALQQAIAAVREQKMFWSDYGMTNAVKLWQHDLQERITEGWTDYHQTNDLLKDMACYGIVFCALKSQKLIDYMVAAATAAPGYRQYCRHQHEIERRAAEWARCCEGFYTPYPSYPNRPASYREHFDVSSENNNLIAFPHPNQQRQQQTLERITAVVASLKGQGIFPATASERAKTIIAASKQQYGMGVSQTTLHKPNYLPLWHPLHEGGENTPASEQRVNAEPEPVTASLQPEKYPQLPDPWLADEMPEPLLQQEVQQIYTPPSYMKVVYLPSANARLLLPAFTSEQKIQTEILNQKNNSDSSVIDKQIQCLQNSGDCQKFDKAALSITETTDTPTSPAGTTEIDSNIAINIAITIQEASVPEAFVSTSASVPLSIPASTPISIPPGVSYDGSSAPDAAVFSQEDYSPPVVSFPLEPEPVAGTADLADSNAAITAPTFTPEQHRQAIRLKLQTIAQAKHWVKTYCIAERLHLTPVQRQKMEQLAQRLLMRESGSPILQHEAEQWLAANQSTVSLFAHLKEKTAFSFPTDTAG